MELRLILGDQLNAQHSWFRQVQPDVTYIMMEVREEATYVTHHVQKVLCFFASMRSFAAELRAKGHRVEYLHLLDPNNCQSITGNIRRYLDEGPYTAFACQEADEYRLDAGLKELMSALNVPATMVPSEHFIVDRQAFATVFPGKKSGYLMETFYRHIRKKENLLMQDGKPMFGKWNFDAENRKKCPPKLDVPEPFVCNNDLSAILKEIQKAGIATIGEVDADKVLWPIDRKQSLALLDFFCTCLLPQFGTYQDAMAARSWSLFHARISFALNTKMIGPAEVIQAAIASWERTPDQVAFHQLEGFIRQIAGWREYMRCLYWAHMPGYAELNFFSHDRALPSWYWTGKTKMRCLSVSIRQSLEYAYAHHIQRLMVTGNFALLAGIHPDETDRWYLGIYIDAIEWVEITNTRGMSQYADGGLAATKPYVSSAAYIDKMSDYCSSCHYNKALKTGDGACPFNSLYWAFLDRHRMKLANNPRMSMMYNVWDKMRQEDQTAILQQAAWTLENMELL